MEQKSPRPVRKALVARKVSVPADIRAYDRAQSAEHREICARLGEEICRGLPKAEGKIWHGGPVWFIDGNPVVGYWARKAKTIQWDYKNIVKRRGKLEKLGTW